MMEKIICGDCIEEMKKLPDEYVDGIITDPPYGTNYGKIMNDETLDIYKKSLKEMFRVLKNNTFLITYCFPLYVPDIIEEARKNGFTYRWIGFNYYPNMFKQKPQPLGYNRYDLFLIFSKGDAKKRGYIKDTIHIVMDKKNNKEREFGHPHQKPEKCAEKLVKAIVGKENSDKDFIFLDPFCGSGVFLCEALKKGCNIIGIDISEEYCSLTRKRLTQLNDYMRTREDEIGFHNSNQHDGRNI